MIKKFKAWVDELKPMNTWDIVFYLLIALFCFFSFNHSDMLHTGGSSFTLLKGHFRDFYDANLEHFTLSNYLLSTYIVYALWNLPLLLLHIVKQPTMEPGAILFWYKTLSTLFLIGSAFVMYNIGRAIGLSGKNSKLLTAFWVSSPILFFSQFIFGQYDIITAFFVLLGVLYYLKKDMNLFILFFAVSATFKYFPVFLFVPLLLLVEKRPLHIIRAMALFIIPLALEVLPFMNSGAFKAGVMHFGMTTTVFFASFAMGQSVNLSVFIVSWSFMAALAYWKDIKNDAELYQWSLYLGMFASSLIFALIFWNPQWVLFATPFLAITTLMNKKAGFFILLDIVMMFLFTAYTVNVWPAAVDQALWMQGIFRGVHKDLTDPLATVFMRKFLLYDNRTVYFSLLSACFLANIALKFPGTRFDTWQKELSPDDIGKNWNAVRVRFFLGIMFFIIPAVLSLTIPNGRVIIYDTHKAAGFKSGPAQAVIKGAPVGQVFTAGCKELRAVVVQTAAFNRVNSCSINFKISEYTAANNKGKVIFERPIHGDEFTDNGEYIIKMKKVMVSPEKKYIFTFESPDAAANNCVGLMRDLNNVKTDRTFAVVNNKPQKYSLDFRLYGKK